MRFETIQLGELQDAFLRNKGHAFYKFIDWPKVLPNLESERDYSFECRIFSQGSLVSTGRYLVRISKNGKRAEHNIFVLVPGKNLDQFHQVRTNKIEIDLELGDE